MSIEHREFTAPVPKNPFDLLKVGLVNAPVMAFLSKFDIYLKKKERILTKWEVLFEPGENPYLYIIASWALAIFQVSPTNEAKEVGKVYTGGFIGEWVLSDRTLKDVRAASHTENTLVVALDSSDFEFLEVQDPATLASLYKHINNITSLRLAQSGRELAVMYEATQKFQEYRNLGGQWLLKAIVHMKISLSLDNVVMIEEHPFVPGLLVYKYNTKFPSIYPLNQKVEEAIIFNQGVIAAEILTIRADQNAYCMPMLLWEKTIGYIVAAATQGKKIEDGDIRLLEHLSPMIASMVVSVQMDTDARARALNSSE